MILPHLTPLLGYQRKRKKNVNNFLFLIREVIETSVTSVCDNIVIFRIKTTHVLCANIISDPFNVIGTILKLLLDKGCQCSFYLYFQAK